jgi:hypothetical protein
MFKLENQLENSNYGWLKDESHVEVIKWIKLWINCKKLWKTFWIF